MRLLCWVVLASLLVESFQKPGIKEVTSVPATATEHEEGSGGSSESNSEEHTEAIPDKREKNVKVLILPDETAPPSSNETNSDSDETIKRALSSNQSKKVEDSALTKSSDLIDLGESADKLTPQPQKSHGEEPPQAEEPLPVRSYLSDGKLRPEIDDRIKVSPTPGDSQMEKHTVLHREPPLNDGKSGAVIDDGKLSGTVQDDSEVGGDDDDDDRTMDKVVRIIDPMGFPNATMTFSAEFDPTTANSTGHPLTTTAKSTGHPLSTTAKSTGHTLSTTTVPAATTTIHPHEVTTVFNSTSSDTSGKTHAPVEGDTSRSPVTEPSSNGTHASTESPTEPSSTLSDVTTVSSSRSTHSSVETSTEPPHRSNAVNIYALNRYVFQKGDVGAFGSELQCTGPYCDTPVETVTCEPTANLTLENTPSSLRYTIPIQWSCGSSDFEPEFRITKSSVVCQAYDHPGDPWVVKGSCVLIFQLGRLQSSPYTGRDNNGQNMSVVAIILSMLVVTALGYFAIKAVILKRKHGYWVPSYCALPVKARMNFRRKRQTDFDEEPVNVHFDMGEEQTSIGRTRIRSYGSK